jgi:c-di-GMP-binding flagellar brake protein YcgR
MTVNATTAEWGERADESRFGVRDAAEILHVLRALCDSHSLVALHAGASAAPLLSVIIDIDKANGRLYLDCASEPDRNQRLLEAQAVTCIGHHDHVRVEFTLGPLKWAQHEGRPAFVCPIPAHMLYYQRRGFFRLPLSVVHPAVCLIPTAAGDVVARLIDISIGGGMLNYTRGPDLRAGQTYTGCRLTLPDSAPFPVNLGIIKVYQEALANGTVAHRAAGRFINLPASLEDEIQRFIRRVERERRASR